MIYRPDHELSITGEQQMKTRIRLGFIVILGFIALTGCNGQKAESAQGQNTIVLKSYKVPEGLARDIYDDINGLLYSGAPSEPAIGRARIAPDGQLLVAAPESFHDGMKDFIEEINKNNPGPTPTAEVDYWIVAGRKSKTPAKLDEFQAIKAALETIQNTQGSMEFKLLDHLAATSSGQGKDTRLSGAYIEITQSVSAYSDGSLVIHPRIIWNPRSSMETTGGRIDTQISTKSGELVVLGQLSQEFGGGSIFGPKRNGEKQVELVNVFYIISSAVKK